MELVGIENVGNDSVSLKGVAWEELGKDRSGSDITAVLTADEEYEGIWDLLELLDGVWIAEGENDTPPDRLDTVTAFV
jgi:hypothetical protein